MKRLSIWAAAALLVALSTSRSVPIQTAYAQTATSLPAISALEPKPEDCVNISDNGKVFIHTSAENQGSFWFCGQVLDGGNQVGSRWFKIPASTPAPGALPTKATSAKMCSQLNFLGYKTAYPAPYQYQLISALESLALYCPMEKTKACSQLEYICYKGAGAPPALACPAFIRSCE